MATRKIEGKVRGELSVKFDIDQTAQARRVANTIRSGLFSNNWIANETNTTVVRSLTFERQVACKVASANGNVAFVEWLLP